MHEDFAGNTLGTAKALELTSSLQTFRSSVSPLDTIDYYSFNLSNHSSFNMTLSGLGANADVQLLNSRGEVLQTSAQSGTSSESLFTSLNAGSYYIKVYSSTQASTNYNLNLSAIPDREATSLQNRDAVTGFENPSFDTGVFTVGSSGQVSIDYLFDGGAYQGELAIFSLKGMEQFEGGIDEFIGEAARRALSDSQLGHIVISDSTEGARFHGSFFEEPDFNSGEYLGVRTFSMRPGDTFGVMLVPDGTVQQVSENPGIEGATRPLFSLSTRNPNEAFHLGQIADVNGKGNTFTMEDLRVDGCSDKDYNDIIFQVRGATGQAVKLDEVIDPVHDWRSTDLGKALIAYAKPYVTSPEPIVANPSLSPVTDTNSIVTSPLNSNVTSSEQVNAQPSASSAIETNSVVTSFVDSTPVSFDFPVANQPLVGIVDTGFSANNPDIDYSRITLGRDRISNDNNPLLQPGEGNEHGTHVLGIIGATQNNGIGVDGVNDKAPIWLGRAVGSGQWAESLVEFVNAARDSKQPNAVVNLSMDLTQVNPDGSVTTRYELTPQERAAIEYARQYNVLIVVAAGNDGGVMSALGQASQEFDNIITVGSAQDFDPTSAPANGFNRADYSSYGYGLDIMANGGTTERPVLSTVGNGVGTMAGTSVAAAEVTGAVSQVWAANPQLSYRQVIEIIKSTATDLDKPNWYAYGRMLETGLLPAGAKANGWFLGNAEAWRRDAARAGLPVSSTPTPGARGLVVWPPGVRGGHPQYGHVAFLEEVYPDGRIRISESNWAGQGISERTLTPAQYSGLSFVRLENATPNPSFSSPPARSGQQREYRVRPGDTLSGIAYRELGDANRWREITKADSTTFTDAEARNLQVGQSVYLPVSYQNGLGTFVKAPPDSTPNPAPSLPYWGTVTGTNSLGETISHRIGIERADGSSQAIDPSKSTWLVIHGMQNNPPQGDILDELRDTKNLANAVDGYSLNDQVLVLDWRSAAYSPGATYGNANPLPNPYIGASWIDAVATWAANTLKQWGIVGSNINLVGHSLGTYVAAEIAAKISGGVNDIIALDPAQDGGGYNLGGGHNSNQINFSQNSRWSWGFYGSLFGQPDRAKTAKESFEIDFGPQLPDVAHGAVEKLFTHMVNEANDKQASSLGDIFGLDKLNSTGKPWNIDYGSSWEAKLIAKNENGSWMLKGINNNP